MIGNYFFLDFGSFSAKFGASPWKRFSRCSWSNVELWPSCPLM